MTRTKTLKMTGSDPGSRCAFVYGSVAPVAASAPDSDGGRIETRGHPRLDHLENIWGREVLPLLEEKPDLRGVAIFEELMRSHPELGEVFAGRLIGVSANGAWSMAVSARLFSLRLTNRVFSACRISQTCPVWE